MAKHSAFIALGSNLGDPKQRVNDAMTALDQVKGIKLIARSSLYSTAPVGYADQPDFINACVQIETDLSPQALLAQLQTLEHQQGRERIIANGPRTLDLDILLYDDLQHHEHGLTLPHPRMHERAFVLQPLIEIAPVIMIPGKGSAAEWLQKCADQGIKKLN
jgi:2-amino-4-hydroxy-6-hydroxymethyldihydropteridine diphosphokinase